MIKVVEKVHYYDVITILLDIFVIPTAMYFYTVCSHKYIFLITTLLITYFLVVIVLHFLFLLLSKKYYVFHESYFLIYNKNKEVKKVNYSDLDFIKVTRFEYEAIAFFLAKSLYIRS